MIRVAILDVDGTLMDTNYLHVEAWARAFRDLGIIAPRATIHRAIGRGSDQLIPLFVTDSSLAARANELHSQLYASMQPLATPLPGARELVRSLHERGYAPWLATSAKSKELAVYLSALAATDLVAGSVASEDVDHSKPAADIFVATLQRAGIAPEEGVVAGDTIWDVQAANAAGLRTVCVLTGGAYSRAELLDAGAVAVYQDCADLLRSGFPEGL